MPIKKHHPKKTPTRLPHSGSLADHFHHLENLGKDKPLTLRVIVDELGYRSHSLIIFVLSLLFVFPLTIPALSFLIGPIIMLVGIGIVIRRPPWIPAKLMTRSFHREATQKFLKRAARYSQWLERFTHPRLQFLVRHRWIDSFNGLLIILGGLFLLVHPPFTHMLPGLMLAFLSLAILEEDGLMLLIGYGFTCLNILFFGALAHYGWREIKNFFL
jgi:hypothetical protein